MTTRSGLDSQFGFAAETTWGTAVTPTKFVEYDDEDFVLNSTWLENEGLAAGRVFKRVTRVGISRYDVNGQVTIKHPNKGMGVLWKHCMGSAITTPTQIAATTAYKQIHTYSARVGLGLTVQIGRPEPGSGTVVPFTYAGCKVSSWEFSVSDGEAAKLVINFDGKSETTATGLAAASYSTNQIIFTFKDATNFKLGGTASTASGETTIAGGVAVAAIINNFTIRGEVPLAGERYGLGNAGFKAQQLENDYPTITGSFDAEFANTELYALYANASTTALQLDLSNGDAGGGNPFLLSFIAPAIKTKTAKPSVDGPGLVRQATEFEAYDDGTNPTLQVKLVSTDTTL